MGFLKPIDLAFASNSCGVIGDLSSPITTDDDSTSIVDDHGTFSSWDPQYELNTTNGGTGQPYTSILDLRADKIQNLLSIQHWDWISDFVSIQYEDLLMYGTYQLIKRIEVSSNVESICAPSPPAPQRLNKTKLRSNYIEFMNSYYKHWDTEELIEYYPIPSLQS